MLLYSMSVKETKECYQHPNECIGCRVVSYLIQYLHWHGKEAIEYGTNYPDGCHSQNSNSKEVEPDKGTGKASYFSNHCGTGCGVV